MIMEYISFICLFIYFLNFFIFEISAKINCVII